MAWHALIEHPATTRAVAVAVAQNPITYLIPCHRVTTRSGQVHNHRWGKVPNTG